MKKFCSALLLLSLGFIPTPMFAQAAAVLTVPIANVGGGGGVSTGQVFSINGFVTSDASLQMTGAVYSVSGGSVAALAPISSFPGIPEGSVIYERHHPADDTTSIWMASLQGNSDVFVTSGFMGHVSVDRRYLVFTRDGPFGRAWVSRGDVWVRDLVTGSETKLHSSNDYTVSADISLDDNTVFFDFYCSDYSIPRDNSANGNPLYLSGGNCYDDGPAVNPVDGRIAYFNNGNLGVHGGIGIADTNFQNKVLIPNATLGTYASWSHDGQWLCYTLTPGYYTYAGQNLYKIRPDGTGRTQLTFLTNSSDAFPLGAAWVGGDTSLIGAGIIGGTNGLFRIAADGSGAISMLNITQPGDPIAYVLGIVGRFQTPTQISLSFASNGKLSLNWSSANFSLETAISPSGPWNPVAGATNPYIVVPNGAQGFFRLRQQ